MAEKVNIATLQIDMSDVLKKSADYKKKIDELKEAQKGLDKSTEEGRVEYEKMNIQIQQLNKSYKDNQQFAKSLDSVNKDLEKTLSSSNKSTQELRDSRSQLNQISKQLGRSNGELTGDIEEELKLRDRINKAIDEQTEALRGQSSEFNKSKDRVGEYKSNILEAVQELKQQQQTLVTTKKELEAARSETKKGSDEYEEYSQALTVVNKDLEKVNKEVEDNSEVIDISNFSLGGFLEASKTSGGSFKMLSGGLKAATTGMWGLVKSALAFIATPIGVILAAIVGAFLLVKNAMNRSEEATNKIKVAFSAFSGIISGVLKALQPLGEFLINGIVKSLEMVQKGLFSAMNALAKGLKFLGFDEAAKSLTNFNTKIEESAKAAQELTKAELELSKAQREAKKVQLSYQKDAEKLRQLRDDESKSISSRIRANELLGKTLKKQTEEELKIANKALEVAKMRIRLDGETTENLNKLKEAETEIVDIRERITGQESEQLTNRISLLKEAAEKAIDLQKGELDVFLNSQGVKAKSLQDELNLAEQVSKKKIAILDAELKAKKINQSAYNASVLEIQNDLLSKQAELSADNAKRELDMYIQSNKSKLKNDQFLSQEVLEEEILRLNNIAEEKANYEKVRLEQGVITEQEYNDNINAINEENRLANEELETQRKEAANEQRMIDFENDLAILQEQQANEREVKLLDLEMKRQQEIKSAEKTGADISKINKKYNLIQKKINQEADKTKLEETKKLFGNIAQLFGESTAVGKAAGIATATINTYQGVTEVWKAPAVLPEPLNTASKVAATGVTLASGLSAVKKISGVNEKFARGGILQGNSHAMGGIQTAYGEVEGGEAVINKKSTSLFSPLLSAINQAGGGRKFAEGGILGVSTSPSSFLDYDLLAEKLADANANLPNPIVSVEEISEVGNRVSVIENDADL